MKQIILSILLLISSLQVSAQQYIGSMNADGYTRDEVEATVSQNSNGTISILLHRVKFSMFMPVKVDVLFPGITRKGNKLTADNKIPSVKNKPYEKFTIHQLNGTLQNGQLVFTCKLGSKSFTYRGKKK